MVVPPPAPGDSADTGAADTGADGPSSDTAAPDDSGDTAEPVDTAEPIDTEEPVDSGDSGRTDTADSGGLPTFAAAYGAKEAGGFGCTSVTGSTVGLLWIAGLCVVGSRRRER
jgi:hypothetical protein